MLHQHWLEWHFAIATFGRRIATFSRSFTTFGRRFLGLLRLLVAVLRLLVAHLRLLVSDFRKTVDNFFCILITVLRQRTKMSQYAFIISHIATKNQNVAIKIFVIN